MKVRFDDYMWTVFENFDYSYSSFPRLPCVYVLCIKSKHHKRRFPVYIGVTRDVYSRMKSHEVLRLLLYNKSDYTIHILCKCFDGFNKDRKMEKQLISRYKTVFNIKNNGKQLVEFWGNVGLSFDKIKYKSPRIKKPFYNTSIKKL